ncbi:MAG: AmmeMemoRadiSam system radical SAM enzyme [Bifidobacteriaceae bacterium]|jgi:pyruvate formate lyase activating enzyme|nr:AmmeMemoRadiSam system radical SAM enzyme [Bifidobacteriaceae bacterium]
MPPEGGARYWHPLADSAGRIQCDLCPRHCRPRPGQRGFCFVRRNTGGQMELTTYGRSSGFAVDPMEKKPLNHVLPGSTVFSFGTAGCNLACQFCQNWDLSAAREMDRLMAFAEPSEIAAAAAAAGCRAVAYTYNDPVIFAEYAIDTAAACRELGLLNVAVTAGYIEGQGRADLFGAMDAANIDLKAFSPEFYRRLTGARLEAVLDTLCYVVKETPVWVEITTLLIPGHNDSEAELDGLTSWIADQLGPDVPLHFTAFHPAHRLTNTPRTPLATLLRARTMALANGLRYVYTGNVADPATSTTYCPGCGSALVERDWFTVLRCRLGPDGTCPDCGQAVPGRWG